jgi:hypothetical protein
LDVYPTYEADILGRLDNVHKAVLPVLTAAAGPLPRLSTYAAKLSAPLDKIHAGGAT